MKREAGLAQTYKTAAAEHSAGNTDFRSTAVAEESSSEKPGAEKESAAKTVAGKSVAGKTVAETKSSEKTVAGAQTAAGALSQKIRAAVSRNKRVIWIGFATAVLIIVAYICRFPFMNNMMSGHAGILRSAIYISLFAAWGISVHARIMQVQARRYFTAVAFLMVFWMAVRTAKYLFVSPETHPNAARYLWYFYYLPMLFIPLLLLLAVLSMGKPENYRLPRAAGALYIPSAVLFALVITNDFHQAVFAFPKDARVWTSEVYGYAGGYFAVVGWLGLCILLIFFTLCMKSRIPGRRRLIILPCIPIALLIVYIVLYYMNLKWLKSVFGDMNVVMCLLCIATLEMCIWCGFIQTNTHYRELFDAATVGTQITDGDYRVLLSSAAARTVDESLMRRTENGPCMLEGGIRLSGEPIRGGHVIWTEDLSDLSRVLGELKEAKEELEDSNGLLEEENELRAREAHIAQQERLYDLIQRSTQRQLCLADGLIGDFEAEKIEEGRLWILKKLSVIGAFLKRRSNLIFAASHSPVTKAEEIRLTFRESLENLEFCGVECAFFSEIKNPVRVEYIMAMYDLFEKAVELSLGRMSALTVYCGGEGEGVFMTVNTDSSADLGVLASDSALETVRDMGSAPDGADAPEKAEGRVKISAVRDEDGEWQLTLRVFSEGII